MMMFGGESLSSSEPSEGGTPAQDMGVLSPSQPPDEAGLSFFTPALESPASIGESSLTSSSLFAKSKIPGSGDFEVEGLRSGDATVFVMGLSPETTREGLLDRFSRFPGIVKAYTLRQRDAGGCNGVGMVTFSSSSAAKNAYETLTKESTPTSGIATATGTPFSSATPPTPLRLVLSSQMHEDLPAHCRPEVIFVRDVPTKTEVDPIARLQKFFSAFDGITNIKLLRQREGSSRAVAAVTFISRMEAVSAMEELSGSIGFEDLVPLVLRYQYTSPSSSETEAKHHHHREIAKKKKAPAPPPSVDQEPFKVVTTMVLWPHKRKVPPPKKGQGKGEPHLHPKVTSKPQPVLPPEAQSVVPEPPRSPAQPPLKRPGTGTPTSIPLTGPMGSISPGNSSTSINTAPTQVPVYAQPYAKQPHEYIPVVLPPPAPAPPVAPGPQGPISSMGFSSYYYAQPQQQPPPAMGNFQLVPLVPPQQQIQLQQAPQGAQYGYTPQYGFASPPPASSPSPQNQQQNQPNYQPSFYSRKP